MKFLRNISTEPLRPKKPGMDGNRPVALGLAVLMSIILVSASNETSPSDWAATMGLPTQAQMPKVSDIPAQVGLMDVVNSQVVYAASGDGLKQTDNAGKTWSNLLVRPGLNITTVDFATPQVGWVWAAGRNSNSSPAILLKTKDGGRMWTPQLTCPKGDQGSAQIVMQSAMTGWALVAHQLYATSDGGSTWNRLVIPSSDQANSITAGTSGPLWVTADHGADFELLTLSSHGTWRVALSSTTGTVGPLDVVSSEVDYTMVNGSLGDPEVGTLEKTTNGGQTWQVVQAQTAWTSAEQLGYVTSLAFDENLGWIGTSNGAQGFQPAALLVTSNGGRTWQQVGTHRLWAILAVKMTGRGGGWLLGTSYFHTFLAKTTDGGLRWDVVWPVKTPLVADFSQDGSGYGLGTSANPDAFLITRDQGAEWTTIDRRVPAIFSSFSFDGAVGLALTNGIDDATGNTLVRVYRTDTSGHTWKYIATLTAPELYSPTVSMLSPTRTVLISLTHTWGTTNGGFHWTRVATIGDTSIQSVDFTSLRRVWGLAAQGSPGSGVSLWVSSNDGIKPSTRLRIPGQHDISLSSPVLPDFLTPQAGWIVLQRTSPIHHGKPPMVNTVLYHTENGGRTWTLVQLEKGLTVHSLQFVSQKIGYLTVNQGVVLKTLNAGTTWTFAYPGEREAFAP